MERLFGEHMCGEQAFGHRLYLTEHMFVVNP
jgi:hypothetical protein